MSWRRAGDGARRSTAAAAALASCWLGCSGPPSAGRTLGADLGTFSVDAAQGENDCGAGALGSQPEFVFDVELARADTELFWDGRVGGRLGPALDFEFAANVSVELRPARGADPGCAMLREDLITGALAADDAGELTSFTADMTYSFSAEAESTCTLEEAQAAGLSRLPCRMSYTLAATRTRAPTP